MKRFSNNDQSTSKAVPRKINISNIQENAN